MKAWTFKAELYRPDGARMMTVVPIPSDIERDGGFRARQRIRAKIDKVQFSTSLLSSGDGWIAFVVNKELLARLDRQPGDRVTVVMERDESPPVVEVPPALRAALKTAPRARAQFDKLAPSHRKAYAQWIGSAKREETAQRRALEAVRMLGEGRTLR